MLDNQVQATISGKFDLILEKMENLNEKYATHAHNDVEHFGEIRKNLENLTNKLDKHLFGDETGLVVRMALLENSEKKRNWFAKTAFGGVIASFGAHIWSLIKG